MLDVRIPAWLSPLVYYKRRKGGNDRGKLGSLADARPNGDGEVGDEGKL